MNNLGKLIDEVKKIQDGYYVELTELGDNDKKFIHEEFRKILKALEYNKEWLTDTSELVKEIRKLSNYMVTNYNGRNFERISVLYYQKLDNYEITNNEELAQVVEELKFLLINYQEYIEEFDVLSKIFDSVDLEIVARVILDANTVFNVDIEDGNRKYKSMLKYIALKRYKKSLKKIKKITSKEVKDMLVTYLNYFSPLEK